MTKIRGGKQAYDQLLTDLQVIETALRDAKHYATRAKLVEDVADDGLHAVRVLRDLVRDVIGPMLERRDRAGAHDLEDLIGRVAQLEAQVAELLRERRNVVPFPERKQQEGR